MKNIEAYRKIAILLENTKHKISVFDVYAFLNGDVSGLSKKKIAKLKAAEADLIDLASGNREEYSLAKEYAMISNSMGDMEDAEGFIQVHTQLYDDSVKHFNEVGFKIIDECISKYPDEISDLIVDGKITDENGDEAIYRYMIHHGYKNLDEDPQED